MGAAWLKMGGGLIYFLFLYPKRGEGLIGEGLKREGGLNIEITVPPFLPLLSQTCCRRGGKLQGLKHGLQG
jgi:hypothetical protein